MAMSAEVREISTRKRNALLEALAEDLPESGIGFVFVNQSLLAEVLGVSSGVISHNLVLLEREGKLVRGTSIGCYRSYRLVRQAPRRKAVQRPRASSKSAP
ncbi:MAG: hypothetical protein M0000_00370 [Actinomycetota bacterium]|nr:hypothetical protein [Actinomycetota bacterium]